jgi:endonuclease/exonuclease/phosphatase family metal-dependent hydrolase
MKFVLYNIRYATGSGWKFHFPIPFSGYFRPTNRNLEQICRFLKDTSPDIIGLVEVDNGSFRTEKFSQAENIARQLGFTHVYESKYGLGSFPQYLPVMREQGNAFLTNQNIHATGFHYFEKGIKRLVIELEFENFVIFLVHLSVRFRHRHDQLRHLHSLLQNVSKPKILAGDFNPLWGDKELDLFMAATGLQNANIRGQSTFPSHAPKRQLDFILHSDEIAIKRFEVPRIRFSDHLPVVCEFELRARETR